VTVAIDFEAINRAAGANGRTLVERLVPGGRFRSLEYRPLNPRRNDNKAGSFSINYRTGQWGDFATGDKGGDFVSLVAYVKGIEQCEAARDLAAMINLPLPRNGANGVGVKAHTTRTAPPVDHQPPPIAADVPIFPTRTPPDDKGKPTFVVAGDAGPEVRRNELRRHVYCRENIPVRIKTKFGDGHFANWYRVTDTAGTAGWQAAKPVDYIDVPYVTQGMNPFNAEVIEDAIFWPEGEKDVDALTKLGLLAFTFGGTGDGLPLTAAKHLANRDVVILADNDDPGRKHAQAKAAAACPIANSVRVIEFPELRKAGDISDWIVQGGTADELNARAYSAPLWVPPVSALDKSRAAKPPRKLISQNLSSVALEKVEWLWPGRIAIGKLTLFGGKPGVGKSQLMSHLTAVVSQGAAWPCNEGRTPRGNVVLFSAEDGVADTIAPRLIAAGADATRVTVVKGVEDTEGRKTFDLKADIDLLETAVREIGDVKLIIIDPVSAYMGKIDGHGNVETRSVLEPIAEMADRLRIAVIAVTHLNKGGAGNQGVMERFVGSIAFIAAARAGFAVIPDEENEGRVLVLSVKNNLAPKPRGLAFRCLQTIVGDGIVASLIDWENDYVAHSADEALSASEQGPEAGGATAKEQAIDFLQAVLSSGPKSVRDIEAEAVAAGLHEAGKPIGQNKPLRDARKALRVETRKSGAHAAGWVWMPPCTPKVPSKPEDARSWGRAPSISEGTFGENDSTSLPVTEGWELTHGTNRSSWPVSAGNRHGFPRKRFERGPQHDQCWNSHDTNRPTPLI
jgi:putative DNA primase/helicase